MPSGFLIASLGVFRFSVLPLSPSFGNPNMSLASPINEPQGECQLHSPFSPTRTPTAPPPRGRGAPRERKIPAASNITNSHLRTPTITFLPSSISQLNTHLLTRAVILNSTTVRHHLTRQPTKRTRNFHPQFPTSLTPPHRTASHFLLPAYRG
jgi:hypothetical protein